MRVVLGAFVIAASLAVAVWLHSGYEGGTRTVTTGRIIGSPYGGRTQTVSQKADWQDPLAVFLAVMGLGVGTAIILPAVRTVTPSARL